MIKFQNPRTEESLKSLSLEELQEEYTVICNIIDVKHRSEPDIRWHNAVGAEILERATLRDVTPKERNHMKVRQIAIIKLGGSL